MSMRREDYSHAMERIGMAMELLDRGKSVEARRVLDELWDFMDQQQHRNSRC